MESEPLQRICQPIIVKIVYRGEVPLEGLIKYRIFGVTKYMYGLKDFGEKGI